MPTWSGSVAAAAQTGAASVTDASGPNASARLVADDPRLTVFAVSWLITVTMSAVVPASGAVASGCAFSPT